MPPSFQMRQDAEHLKLLAIFHYVMAGLSLLGGLFGASYMVMGMYAAQLISKMPTHPGSAPRPPGFENIGWIFTVIGGGISLICLALAVGQFLAARWLSARQNKTFCMVIAGLTCLNIPLGTALGVFTFMVLTRPSVAATFESPETGFTTPHA